MRLVRDVRPTDAIVAMYAKCRPLLAALTGATDACAAYTRRAAFRVTEQVHSLYVRDRLYLVTAGSPRAP
ncbi:MAG: hypothetical protein AB7P37_21520 [Ramlibacter sp.]